MLEETNKISLWAMNLEFEPPHDKTSKMTVHPAKTQISLGIHPVWSESLLCAQWVAKDPWFLHADSEDSDQTGRMPRLIWVFSECTCHFVGFTMMRLIYFVRKTIIHKGECFLKGLFLWCQIEAIFGLFLISFRWMDVFILLLQ